MAGAGGGTVLRRCPVPAPPAVAEAYRRAGWWPDRGLRAGLERVADAEPDRPAVADRRGASTYGELRRRVERAIGELAAAGHRPGDPALLVAPNRTPSAVAFAALLRASAVVVALDRRVGPADVASAVAATDPGLVVAPADLVGPLGLGAAGPTVLDLDALGSGHPPVDDWPEPDPLAPRVVLFTSGTTRRPKAVVHHLHSFGAGVANLGRAFGWTAGDAPFLCSPLASITGLTQLELSLGGGCLVLEDEFSPGRSVELLERHHATLLGGAPVITELLLGEYRRQQRPSTSLRTIALGGSMIPPEVVATAVRQFGIGCVRVYGSSEAPTHTAAGAGGDRLDALPLDEGVALGGGAVTVGAPAAPDEVMVKGPNLFQGYLDEADNRDAFADGWFRTGDLGELAGPEGRLTVRGRLKEVVDRKGLKISLAEADEALRRLPGVLEGAAFAVADPETGERLAVALRVAPGAAAGYDALCAGLRRAGIATGKLPEQVDLWPDPLPRTPSGKVQRRALASPPPGVRTELAPRLRGQR
ncbi:MAG: class I adenylate-forming enzyme family protein [Acidimicrobiales bacterium]